MSEESAIYLPGSSKYGSWKGFYFLSSTQRWPNGPFWASNDEEDLRIRQVNYAYVVDHWYDPTIEAGPFPSLRQAQAAYWFELLKLLI